MLGPIGRRPGRQTSGKRGLERSSLLAQIVHICDVRLVFAAAVTVIAGGDVVLTVDFVVEIGAVLTQARLAAFATGDLLPVVAVRVGRVQLVMCVLGRG